MSCCKTEKEISPVEKALAERHAKQVAEKERQNALVKIDRFNKLMKADMYMEQTEDEDKSRMYGYINAFDTVNRPISKHDFHTSFENSPYLVNLCLSVAHIKDIQFNNSCLESGSLVCSLKAQHEFIPFKRSAADGNDEHVLTVPFTVTYFMNKGSEKASLECVLLCVYSRFKGTFEFMVVPANNDQGIHTLGIAELDLSDISIAMGIYTDQHPLVERHLVPTSDYLVNSSMVLIDSCSMMKSDYLPSLTRGGGLCKDTGDTPVQFGLSLGRIGGLGKFKS